MARTEPFDKYLNEYEQWFKEYSFVYQSEIEALRHFIPVGKRGIEIGIGTGRFAIPFNIREGVEPSKEMRNFSLRLGLTVYDAIAENLPLSNESYDFVLMVTTICFIDDIKKAFNEVHRILKSNGNFIVGFVDKNSSLGMKYEVLKEHNPFYRIATFYSVDNVRHFLTEGKFTNIEIIQTIFGELDQIKEVQQFKEGYGEGGFVVIKADKSSN
ncbi:class I SAM-dependent methyltransferase [Melioribacteraceae bacterium 4301-Me]|uniref:class I SAM-dependent methyltransferase n=1 Tax=Pyranulibacter aquaticus TaxID=3163344 RepID=UPI0035976E20